MNDEVERSVDACLSIDTGRLRRIARSLQGASSKARIDYIHHICNVSLGLCLPSTTDHVGEVGILGENFLHLHDVEVRIRFVHLALV